MSSASADEPFELTPRMFLTRRDPRQPYHERETVAHAWCSTDLPQPEGYPDGMQLFVACKSWGVPPAGKYVGKDCAHARSRAVLELRQMIRAYQWQAAADGYRFELPDEVVLIELGKQPRRLPWYLIEKLLEIGTSDG